MLLDGVRYLGDMGFDPRSAPVLRMIITFPDGEVWQREWNMDEVDDMPDGLRPGTRRPEWVDEFEPDWATPIEPVTVRVTVKPGMEADARAAMEA